MTVDLDAFRAIFEDPNQSCAMGVITKMGVAQDLSSLRVQVSLLPEKREVVCFMGFADIYDVTFPELNDLVMVAFDNDDPDGAHVIARFNATDQPIPTFAATGNSVKYARPGKKLYVGSDTKIGLARPNKEPAQPMVLGTPTAALFTALANAFLNATQVAQSAAGPCWLDPAVRSALVAAINTYITTTSTNILSQISFTERGTE